MAVVDSKLSVKAWARDTSGAVYEVAQSTTFVIDSYPVAHAVAISDNVATTSAFGDTLLSANVMVRRLPQGAAYTFMFGQRWWPLLSDSTLDRTDEQWMELLFYDGCNRTRTVRLWDSTGVEITTAQSLGPNKDLSFLTLPLTVGPISAIYSPGITGVGPWASLQDGQHMSSVPSLQPCNRNSFGALFDVVADTVRRHEGSLPGSITHFGNRRSAINHAEVDSMMTAFQRQWWKEGVSSTRLSLAEMNRRFLTAVKALSRGADSTLDLHFATINNSFAGCGFAYY